jgi:hypothetical protein
MVRLTFPMLTSLLRSFAFSFPAALVILAVTGHTAMTIETALASD